MTESEEDDYHEPMTQDFRRRGLQSESDDDEEGYQGGYRNDFHTQPKLTPSHSDYSQSDLDEQIEKEKQFAKKPIMVRGIPRRQAHSSEGSKKSEDIIMSEESVKEKGDTVKENQADKKMFDPSLLFKTAEVNRYVAKPVKIDVSPKKYSPVNPIKAAPIVTPVVTSKPNLNLLPGANYNSEDDAMSSSE